MAMDLATGQVFYGQNTGKVPRSLSEPLATRSAQRAAELEAGINRNPEGPKMPEGHTRKMGIPGSHSEVHAIDQALKTRPGATLGDVAIYNVRTERWVVPAPEMVRCDNCIRITDGVRALTD